MTVNRDIFVYNLKSGVSMELTAANEKEDLSLEMPLTE